MRLLYNIGVGFYILGIRLVSLWNRKASLWLAGRKDIFKKIQTEFQPDLPVIWIHAASLGEFEQGRPLIEALKKQYPGNKILLTFFSPSGYEIRKNYELADYVCYLPADTASNATRFIEIIQPKLVIFVKYEFWYHYLNTLKKQHIPTLLVSAIFRPQQIFFRPYGQFFRGILGCFEHIFVQDKNSLELLNKNNIQNVSITGDTRMDRVWQLSQQDKRLPIIATFKGHHDLLICGSTWPADEQFLLPAFQRLKQAYPKLKFIIAPHQIDEGHISQIEDKLPLPHSRYSKAEFADLSKPDVLIIDNIGMLSTLYRYGKYAYIGGGFGTNIHNIQEAFVYGLPVIFGPKHTKFKEAVDLINLGGGFGLQKMDEFEDYFHFLNKKIHYENARQVCLTYTEQHRGATEQVIKHIKTLNI